MALDESGDDDNEVVFSRLLVFVVDDSNQALTNIAYSEIVYSSVCYYY